MAEAWFSQGRPLNVCAPMVRYSRLAFRRTVRQYGVDVCYSPMIVASSFVRSARARAADFSTDPCETNSLVVQFAASDSMDFAAAAELITPYAAAIDLNCGCPQKWAAKEGIGACLVHKPELVADMVLQARQRTHLPVCVKVRVCPDDRDTVELARRIEHAGAAWLTVHGRTATQHSEPVNLERIKLVKDTVSIPVLANGDVDSLADAQRIHEFTRCDGLMSARGLLANPGLFAGHETTTLEVLETYMRFALETGTPFACAHHHVMFMLERFSSKIVKRELNTITTMASLLDYLARVYGVGILND